ncbi:RagB/SusD family nutrient uptake outer membrane protein [Segetibacter aerophilus]|uniref:Membrane protein n=1 Tax=Segetibacter aerophilus TaxID=670293 RepID=A0A512BIU9_9BACT|nr:RagB/SusD family nutrient uptake outer membrane protein [Segetibacter aerophilus]GEO11902.1 membrane protein [Segetibacter aerophilus]
MKKLLIASSSLLFFTLIFTMCKRQLDLKPLGELTEQTFYQTEGDFEAASLSPYATLLTYYFDQMGNGWYQPVLWPDDDVTVRSNGNDDIEDFNWLPGNGNFTSMWQTSYKGVQRANVILEQLPKAEKFADVSKKVRFEAEAKFMRAYFNFVLAVNWGTPPLVTSTVKSVDQTRLPNSQPGEIWDLIVADLTFAKQNLPATWNSANTGRATSGSASGLLGRVLLYRAQWENKPALYTAADAEFTSIISSNRYNLRPNFADNFALATENNSESLFEIQFALGRGNNWFPNEDGGGSGTGRYIMWRAACEQGICADGANAVGYGFMHAVKPLQDAFEPNDPRRVQTIFREGDPFPSTATPIFKAAWSVTGSTPSKYVLGDKTGNEINGQPNMGVNNERVLRYADILLMSAECKILGPTMDLAGAAALINRVRRRADPTGNILADRPATASKDQMFKFLMQERRVELAFEGHRYNDLVRWHRAGLINIKTDINFGRTPANNNWNVRNLLKPIPQRELDLNNNLKQNPGY